MLRSCVVKFSLWAVIIAALISTSGSDAVAGLVYLGRFETSDGSGRAAEVDFYQNGNKLVINLFNTASAAAGDPTFVLTAVYFDLKGQTSLSGWDAVLYKTSTFSGVPMAPSHTPDSVVIQATAKAADNTTVLTHGTVAGSGEVGGEFAFNYKAGGLGQGTATNGNPFGNVTQAFGVSSSGLGLFGPGNLLTEANPADAINLCGPASPDGAQYGQVGPGGITANPHGAMASPFVENGVTITLTGVTGNLNLNQFSDVTFQYGTGLDEPQLKYTEEQLPVPEPGSLTSWSGVFCLVAALYRRRRKSS